VQHVGTSNGPQKRLWRVEHRGHREGQPDSLKVHPSPFWLILEESCDVVKLASGPRRKHRQLRLEVFWFRGELTFDPFEIRFPISHRLQHCGHGTVSLDAVHEVLEPPLDGGALSFQTPASTRPLVEDTCDTRGNNVRDVGHHLGGPELGLERRQQDWLGDFRANRQAIWAGRTTVPPRRSTPIPRAPVPTRHDRHGASALGALQEATEQVSCMNFWRAPTQ